MGSTQNVPWDVIVSCRRCPQSPAARWCERDNPRGTSWIVVKFSIHIGSDCRPRWWKFQSHGPRANVRASINVRILICIAASIMRPLSRGRPRDNSAVHGASEDVPGMTYDVPGVSYPIPWTSGDCPQGVRPADGPGTHSLASTGPFSQAAVHRASGLLRFSQSQRGRIMDRKWGCPQYVRNRKLMSRSCPGNATATLLAALTFFVKNKLILL